MGSEAPSQKHVNRFDLTGSYGIKNSKLLRFGVQDDVEELTDAETQDFLSLWIFGHELFGWF